MERALLVTVKMESAADEWPLEEAAYELEELAASAGAEAVNNIAVTCHKPTPNFFIGSGKAEEISFICLEENIDTVIFSHDLSGTQQRNLEDAIGRKVIDRTQLILDIFARHATSPEGKVQVELAQLQYLLPRLVGKGIVLSRLGGGIGTRGPGEQKLEVDRRRIRKRIDKLKNDLKAVMRHRKTMRKNRKENAVPAVALVGYTNAGKTTLLNALTGAKQYTQDSLFTTLDPVAKSLQLNNGEHIVILDTVGFLHNLPHHLIEAFKATLEEVIEADLLIQVLDASSCRIYEHSQAVLSVLKGLGCQDKPVVTALNKIDLLENDTLFGRVRADFPEAIAISAKQKKNLPELLDKIASNFEPRMALIEALIPHTRMELLDLFYQEGDVREVEYLSKGVKVKVLLPKIFISKYLRDFEISTLVP